MSVSFTIICNNCGAKSIVSIEEMVKYEDEEKKFVSRNIIQEGEVSLEVDYGYEIINIICEKCGIEVDNESRVENK